MSDILDVPAVRESDLRLILAQHGLAAPIDAGSVKCAACSTQLNWNNIGALLVKAQSLVLFCDDFDCLNSAAQVGE